MINDKLYDILHFNELGQYTYAILDESLRNKA